MCIPPHASDQPLPTAEQPRLPSAATVYAPPTNHACPLWPLSTVHDYLRLPSAVDVCRPSTTYPTN